MYECLIEGDQPNFLHVVHLLRFILYSFIPNKRKGMGEFLNLSKYLRLISGLTGHGVAVVDNIPNINKQMGVGSLT